MKEKAEKKTMLRGASFSPCMTWRYSLTREWPTGKGKAVMVMLNPSKADDQRDDATTTLMVRRAQRDGFQRYEAVNLFALVGTDPKALSRHKDPIGPNNYWHIGHAVDTTDRIIVAWGNGGLLYGRGEILKVRLQEYELWCFGVTNQGMPRFPRAIRSDAPLERFN